MEDADGLAVKKESLLNAVEKCNDIAMLELIFKLLNSIA